MAHVLPTKPRYRPRGVVSLYVSRGQLVARGWRRPGPDPRTPRQLAQRNRFACASSFLKYFTTIVARGYHPGSKPNGRIVGAYQMALSRIVSGCTTYNKGVWRIDYPRVQLAEGRPFPLRGLTVRRVFGRLVLRWRGAAPASVAALRVAAYCPSRWEGWRGYAALTKKRSEAAIGLPKGLGLKTLHVWVVALAADGTIRWASAYVVLAGIGGGSTTSSRSIPGVRPGVTGVTGSAIGSAPTPWADP